MASQMLFLSFIILLFFLGDFKTLAHDVPYDYSFTHECLATPLKPQYGGGIVVNPELNEGLKGWTQVGGDKVEIRKSNDGNNFIVASRANQSSVVQTFQMEADKLYTFSAWVQSSSGDAYVVAMFDMGTKNESAGYVTTKEGCWSMLKGGLVVNASGPVNLYFKMADNSSAEIWVDSISLQPFTQEEWKSHRDQSVEKVRKSKVIFQAVDKNGQPMSNATVSIKQTRPDFPFGNVMNSGILGNPKYQEWFTSRFKYYTVFENEMKWPYVNNEGIANYTDADGLLQFAKSKGLSIRCHTIHWGNLFSVPDFLKKDPIDPENLRKEADAHTKSIVNRYKGELMHWDVVNENIHNSFFDTILGENASTHQFQLAHEIDPKPLLFLNEFNTLERSEDGDASAWKYLQKIWQIRRQGYNGPLAIGLQGHFNRLNLPYLRSSIDILESANLPIWITELDVSLTFAGNNSNVAVYLEQIMREIHAHRAVKGLMMWSATAAWRGKPNECYKMCLHDLDFVNLPAGDTVDKMLAEWTHAPGLHGTTNHDGSFETSLFHGQYEASISNGNPSSPVKFELTPSNTGDAPLIVKISSNTGDAPLLAVNISA